MKKDLSRRVTEILPSGIRRIFDIACANPDGIDLSIGDPDFDVPYPIKKSAIRAIDAGFNSYVSTRGIPELREKLIARLQGKGLQFEDILITAGATGGYYLAMLAVISPGDEVLVLDPYFVSYANVVIMCGGKPVFVDTYPDFDLSEACLLPHITPKTKAIVINNPGNPTGVVYSADELKIVADISNRFGLHIISDEVYDKFVFDNVPFVSMSEVADDAVVVSGFSKSSGMTGWRLGYATAPKHIIDAMATFQQYSYVCANSVAQKAAITAIDFDITEYVARYQARRDKLYEGLKDNFSMRKPGGAFYLFPKAPGGDAEAFVKAAIQQKLFIIPGNVFSEKNTHFRIAFSAGDDDLDRAVDILNGLASGFR